MIPSVLSRQVRHAIEEYLTTQYKITTPRFANTVEGFVQRGDMFKGPYVSFDLPFTPGTKGADYFPQIPLPFAPYKHQDDAFERLSGSDPQPTIVATGTGSGKTESFLYPVLEHCRHQAGSPGVKAILIYPMNALANDQAKRIARIIYNTPSLKDRVTAGLYVGGIGAYASSRMTEESVITRRSAMHKEPPDILLTNYKMLDYLLIQPKTKEIWRHNQTNELRFIVVDELHTFDGAQGTDLACLLRRLKHRLKSPDVCPVGTSATLGADDKEALLGYAKDIFGTTFGHEAIITESRLSAAEFNNRFLWKSFKFPENQADLARLDTSQYSTLHDYIAAQYEVWFGARTEVTAVVESSWASELGRALMEHGGFKNLVQIVESDTIPLADAAERFKQFLNPAVQEHAESALESLLALISFARHPEDPKRPLLNVRVQLWIRELRRMLVSTGDEARLRWFDDLKSPSGDSTSEVANHLPLVMCRNCQKAAWGGTRYADDEPVEASPSKFYEAFFRKSREVTFIFPDDDPKRPNGKQLCPTCLNTVGKAAKSCGECDGSELLNVCIPTTPLRKQDGSSEVELICPYCEEKNSYSILGAQTASLSSVSIGQLFGSRYNDDKKVITFSNSVQDAAHRAGFFQARTYQFAIRTLLFQHIVNEADGQSLSDLQTSFVNALQARHENAEFVGRYIAPNMTWRADYMDLVEYDAADNLERLIDLVSKRLEYEVLLAFGLEARLGRNLENIRSVTAAPSSEHVAQAADNVLEKIRNEMGGLRDLNVHHLRQFIAGLLYRLRISGGIAHPVLKSYIESRGKDYLLSDSHVPYLPRRHPRSARPAFISDFASKAFLPVGKLNQRTWIREWSGRCLFREEAPLKDPSEAAFLVLKALVGDNLLKRYGTGRGHYVWGIRPESLVVTTDLASAQCTNCRDEVCFPYADLVLWDGMPCTRYGCLGTMSPTAISSQDYYRTRYRSYDAVRVVAEEHTGLLDRKQRESVERTFMRPDHQPWDPNVLSCTPTLELGVDIGDLSTVMQTAMPPQRANYVQRIGRAGRRDGNALALSVASARPHDLYYYADPMEMLAGAVDVPGIYLKAPAVLKRQLAAFTLDTWVASGVDEGAVDNRVQHILGRVAKKDSVKFPFDWLAFVESRAEQLLTSFAALFGAAVQEDQALFGQIESYLGLSNDSTSQTLRSEVLSAFTQAHIERADLNKRIRAVTKEISELNKAVKDRNYTDDFRELTRHRGALFSLKATINKKNVFNFLTDAGILPNYGFPQTSVSLKSVIIPNRGKQDGDLENDSAKNDGSEIKAFTEEYVRPGMLAIRELAPGSTFYSGKRRIRIRQIDVKKSPIEKWRMCHNCAYSEPEATADNEEPCPRCDANEWGDTGRVFNMVRMSNVSSVSPDRESRSHDEKEERERTYQHTRTLVQIDDKAKSNAFACSDSAVPFGFEYLKKATVRVINFGQSNSDREPIVIAGKEHNTHGFSCCPECGNVRTCERRGFTHEHGCRNAGAPIDENEDLFLYHEFESEAVRMLLPTVSSSLDSTRIDSFCAALHMGLKEYMGGQLGHLETTTQDDPIQGLELRKTFVFIFDTVPGGTGYLKYLLEDQNNILNVLRLSLDKLKACTCQQNDELDGCYKCLFAYRNNYKRDKISSRAAIEILELILDQGGQLTLIDSLDKLPFNDLLESMCERAFVDRLAAHAQKTVGWTFNAIEIDGRVGYEIALPDHNWIVECQVNLGRKNNIPVESKPDFVLRPKGPSDTRPIAVFADGFAYHRSILADDTNKRMAILASREFRIWSVTWDDLHAGEKHYEDFLPPVPLLSSQLNRFEARNGDLSCVKAVAKASSMNMLLAHLEDPDPRKWEALAYAHAFARISSRNEGNWHFRMRKLAPRWFLDAVPDQSDDVEGEYWAIKERKGHAGCVWVRTSHAGTKRLDIGSMHAGVYIDDHLNGDHKFKPVWNGFLHAMNVLQFLPNSGFFCKSGLDQDEYDALAETWSGRLVSG